MEQRPPPQVTNHVTSHSANPEQPSLSRSQRQTQSQTPLYRTPTVASRSASRLSVSPAPERASTPGAYGSPRPLHRTASSLSYSTVPSSPKVTLQRKSSTSSVRSLNLNQPSSPAAPSPRRYSTDLARVQSSTSYTSQLEAQAEEPPPPTATSVAFDFFTKELASHQDDAVGTQTVVILHDDCYGHRFSRPKTSKSSLSMIVERPERILASVLGVSAAYVRLGSRHSGGHDAPRPDSSSTSTIPFKIRKSSRAMSILSPAVTAVHGKSWMEELKAMSDSAATNLELHLKEITRPVQSGDPATHLEKPTLHEGDLYLCGESLNAFQGAIGGVCDAVDTVFSDVATAPRRAFVAVRPPGHHCSSDFPSGFCWINNVHIGIEYAAQTHGLTHAVIFDFDLHHGDGSQEITWDRNAKNVNMPKNTPISKKTAIGYYSMHDINSYPCEWGEKEKVQNASLCIDNAHGQSIWNVHLQPWKTIDEFWNLYNTRYSVLLEKARSFLRQHATLVRASSKHASPKSAIFISAGFDASEWEGAGMQRHAVNVPTEFYARFTHDVVKLAQEEGTAVDGRVISVLEGGYSDRALSSGVLSHLAGLCQNSTQMASEHDQSEDRMLDAFQSMNISSTDQERMLSNGVQDRPTPRYDESWWHVGNLSALENYITPPPLPPPAPKRLQRAMMPTYATPTETFTQKVVDPIKFNRSMSGTMRPMPMSPRAVAPQVIPEVDWIVATHELSKLLVPSDRQTRSCKPEELAAPCAKKERQSGPPALPAGPVNGGRQLRGRKTKTSDSASPPLEDVFAKMSLPVEEPRRQTISDLPVTSAPTSEPVPIQVPTQMTKRTTRRSSTFNDTSSEQDKTIPPVPSIPHQVLDNTEHQTQIPAVSKLKMPRAHAIKPDIISDLLIKHENAQPMRIDNVPSYASTTSRASQDNITKDRGSSSEPSSKGGERQSGPKRITLKLGSREESERKQKEKEAAEGKAKAEARPKPRKIGVPKSRLSSEQVPKPGDLAGKAAVSLAAREQKPTSLGQRLASLDRVSDPPPQASKPPRPHLQAITIQPPTPASNLPTLQTQPRTAPPANAISPLVMDLHELISEPESPNIFTPTFMNETTPGSSGPSTANPSPNVDQLPRPSVPAPTPLYRSQPAAAGPTTPRQKNARVASNPFFPRPPKQSSQHLAPSVNQNNAQGRTLPVFSSSGAIPFGAPSAQPDLPAYRPAGRTPSLSSDTAAGVVRRRSEIGNGVSRSMFGGAVGVEKKTEGEEEDVLEVPETPQG